MYHHNNKYDRRLLALILFAFPRERAFTSSRFVFIHDAFSTAKVFEDTFAR
ncbi:hypothetical protein LptCag_1326 [Leptospirillum ferriphilum]|uniref:Uncharacterized protein n=1 Tax=Leptospirillum ferriphilum TaxID=178606 RepID=A0A094X313_9BACT|nr:hypothetical protein LptCag_1326 [Leptospirillum ferriphilum]